MAIGRKGCLKAGYWKRESKKGLQTAALGAKAHIIEA
jgi:hypothetical protein